MKIKTNREKITAKSKDKPFRCFRAYHEKTNEENEKKRKEKELRKELLEFLPGVF